MVFVAALGVSAVFAASVSAARQPQTQPVTTSGYTKEQCKNGGFQALGFKNQGQCVSFFAKQQR